MMLRLFVSLALLAVSWSPPAMAQDVAPYEKDLLRLAEILGALYYLRPLCRADDGASWRSKMSELMEAEGGPPDRRERLAGAFNAGYRGYRQSYRGCTDSAELAIQRYLEEGARLSREVAQRYGG